MENATSVRFVLAVNKLISRFNVDMFSIKIVLNLEIFIITFAIMVGFSIELLYRRDGRKGRSV